jgi:hypothetical protein
LTHHYLNLAIFQSYHRHKGGKFVWRTVIPSSIAVVRLHWMLQLIFLPLIGVLSRFAARFEVLPNHRAGANYHFIIGADLIRILFPEGLLPLAYLPQQTSFSVTVVASSALGPLDMCPSDRVSCSVRFLLVINLTLLLMSSIGYGYSNVGYSITGHS